MSSIKICSHPASADAVVLGCVLLAKIFFKYFTERRRADLAIGRSFFYTRQAWQGHFVLDTLLISRRPSVFGRSAM